MAGSPALAAGPAKATARSAATRPSATRTMPSATRTTPTATQTTPTASAGAPLAGRIVPGATYHGVATEYSAGNGDGACLFGPAANLMIAAMNYTDYETAKACGDYVLVQAADGASVTVLITNECPLPCAPGQLDLSQQAFAKLANPAARPHPDHVEATQPRHVPHHLRPVQNRLQPLVVRHPGHRPPQSGGAARGPRRQPLATAATDWLQLLHLRRRQRMRRPDQDHRHLRPATDHQRHRGATECHTADSGSIRPSLKTLTSPVTEDLDEDSVFRGNLSGPSGPLGACASPARSPSGRKVPQNPCSEHPVAASSWPPPHPPCWR